MIAGSCLRSHWSSQSIALILPCILPDDRRFVKSFSRSGPVLLQLASAEPETTPRKSQKFRVISWWTSKTDMPRFVLSRQRNFDEAVPWQNVFFFSCKIGLFVFESRLFFLICFLIFIKIWGKNTGKQKQIDFLRFSRFQVFLGKTTYLGKKNFIFL